MKKLLGAFLVFGSQIAFSGTLTTPLFVVGQGSSGNCHIQNISDRTVSYSVEAFDVGGIRVSGSTTTYLLNPMSGTGIGVSGRTGIWCKFTVFGSTKNVRASGFVLESGADGNTVSQTPAY